ncbi:DUF697 domain-containing protein [Halodesulfovibrio spirochaetisodalis]|uniref:DUF697 domain-containing protein n=1 Tax=Halodesulfovibrio spirochaetisodalis TaxID=1560234 RepID=UPI00082CA148|nr:DUF697 domain-containing protein [Halodesulfovibrio spirochaetisodalis]
MQSKLKLLLILLSGVICIALGSLLLSGIRTIADLSAYIDPAYVPVVFWTLTISGAALLGYSALTMFVFPKPLLLPDNPTEEQLKEYRNAYIDRLRRNPYLKSQQVTCSTEQEITDAIEILEAEANRLIEDTSKRVFIGTATAQNGRLDTLIVFALITHLIYKVTKLYAQRPHMNDLITLYKNVAGTAFFAGALEDIVVEEYTQQIVAPLVATSAVGSIPGAQAVAGVITSSILDGSMNSLLTMRCGIIARNYMSLYSDADLQSQKELRKSATREAAAMFMRTSGDTIATVAQLLIAGASKTVKRSMAKAWDAVRSIAPSGKKGSTAEPENKTESAERVESADTPNDSIKKERFKAARECVSDTTEKIVAGASATGKTISQASKDAATGVASGVSSAAATAGKGVAAAASGATKGVNATAKGMAAAANATGKGISATAASVSSGISTAASAATSVAGSASNGLSSAVSGVTDSINTSAAAAASTIQTAGKKTVSAVSNADAAIKHNVKKSGKKISSAAGKTKKVLARPFSKKKRKQENNKTAE